MLFGCAPQDIVRSKTYRHKDAQVDLIVNPAGVLHDGEDSCAWWNVRSLVSTSTSGDEIAISIYCLHLTYELSISTNLNGIEGIH